MVQEQPQVPTAVWNVAGVAAAAGMTMWPSMANAATLVADLDSEEISQLSVLFVTLVVLISPIMGITMAQKAIGNMSDDDMQAELRSNDPSLGRGRGRR